MPASKKPPGTAVDPRNGSRLVLLPTSSGCIPEPPSGLLKSTVDRWNAYFTDAISGIVQPAELGLIERWAHYLDEWTRAMQALRRSDRLVAGSQGQPRLNPLIAYVKGLESDITLLEDRIGLSPKARLALGVAIGQAQKTLADLNTDLNVTDADDDDLPFIDIGPAKVSN